MDDLVTHIISTELGRTVLACRRFAAGQSDVYAVTVPDLGDYVLKIARPGETWRTHREALVYSLPRACRPVLCAANTAEGYLLMKSAGHTNLSHRFKKGGDCSSLFRQMGQLLREFHNTSLSELSPHAIDELASAAEQIKRIIRRDAPGYFARIDDSAGHQRRWRAFESLFESVLASTGPTCLLHRDYNTRQIIVDAGAERFTAIIDFEYACLGPPVLEFLRMEMSGIRGRSDFYAGYDRRTLESEYGALFAVLDRMHDAIAARESADASHRDLVADLHRLIDAAVR